MVGRAKRALSCFVMTLSYSRALYLEFFFDQTMENFLRGHVHAFEYWHGQPRVILYDNLKSAVLERRGNQIQFHPRLIELSAHYHFAPRPCQVRAGNQKGRVERAIRYVRDSFWAGRTFTTLAECNRQALLWRDQVAHQRRWPGGCIRPAWERFGPPKTNRAHSGWRVPRDLSDCRRALGKAVGRSDSARSTRSAWGGTGSDCRASLIRHF